MDARSNLFILFLAVLTTIGLAQPAVAPSKAFLSADPNAQSSPSMPYVARISGSNVYVRSGPSTDNYPCGKLYKGDTVTVVATQSGWSRIVPPAGSFSWISMRYLKPDPQNPQIGIVTGNAIRVYVGSEFLDPIHSSRTQLVLNRGEKVKLLGERKSDYYKIAPPAGSYRWVSSRYTQPIRPVGRKQPTPTPSETLATSDINEVPPAKVTLEGQAKLEEFYALEKRLDSERAKPIEQQNYEQIKKALETIADDKKAGKVSRYAQFALDQIGRCQLALEVDKILKLQAKDLQRNLNKIDTTRTKRLAELQQLGRFAVIGLFQTFTTYGPGHYLIVDDFGKNICYALPTGPVSSVDLKQYIGKKVGLIGEIQPHLQTAGALVTFTEVVALK